MEDMSKKTKKLEKENEAYRRRDTALNQNILKMAEERNKHLQDVEDVRKKNDKLTSIINQMQQQGRGIPAGMQGTIYGDGGEADEGELEGEEDSECGEYDDEGPEEQASEVESDVDTEEEVPNVSGASMNGHR